MLAAACFLACSRYGSAHSLMTLRGTWEGDGMRLSHSRALWWSMGLEALESRYAGFRSILTLAQIVPDAGKARRRVMPLPDFEGGKDRE